MTSPPASSPDRRPRTVFDHRIETAAGCSVEALWRHRTAGLLDTLHAALADAHRELVRAERDVTFHRTRLARLASGELPVDQALFARIERTVDQLAHAIDARDAQQTTTAAALEPIEAAAPPRTPQHVTAKDVAALLAIARGAKLHEHLITHRLAVATGSHTRISYTQLQHLEASGFVERDTSHPVHAGQPVTLTDAGRAALTAPRPAGPPGTTPPTRPAASPCPVHPRR
ncbi:PadR family transcriptional regulator [Streptomyces sp. GbtcB6]|uniref:PadR family transcriptional regulator n=1 Tax=Streptomyces sp. GbtcB6 TaxID=2824751 RepID=UPI001C30D252|nr:PadR family transcriptional regulator [Streptomyces sp. GbtcB6]